MSAGTVAAARAAGLRTVLWGAWGRDWEAMATPQTVADHLRRTTRPGATLLLHDSDCTSAPGSWKATLGALPLLAENLAERGLRVVTLGDHLADDRAGGRPGRPWNPVG